MIELLVMVIKRLRKGVLHTLMLWKARVYSMIRCLRFLLLIMHKNQIPYIIHYISSSLYRLLMFPWTAAVSSLCKQAFDADV